MASNSESHYKERIQFFQAEFDANQKRATDALKELKWWQDELVAAVRDEAVEAQNKTK